MDYLLQLAILPVLALLFFIYKKDPHPEPIKFLFKIFGFGCLTVIPVLIFELLFESVLQLPESFGELGIFWNTFFGVAMIEEFFKWIVVYIFCYRRKDFDETYDGVVYGACSSLGFACIENILYVVLNFDIIAGILRAVTAVPGHLCYGVIMGYFLAKARLAKKNGDFSIGYIILSLFVPTFLHAAYDHFIIVGSLPSIGIWILFTIALFVFCFVLVLRASKKNTIIGNATNPITAPVSTPVIPSTQVEQISTPSTTSTSVPQISQPQPNQEEQNNAQDSTQSHT